VLESDGGAGGEDVEDVVVGADVVVGVLVVVPDEVVVEAVDVVRAEEVVVLFEFCRLASA